MIIIPHMLAGAAASTQAPNIWIAFCFGLLSHFLLDALPHWDYLDKVNIKNPSHLKKIALDFIGGCLLILILTWFYPEKLFILFGLIGALLPDCLETFYQNFNIKWLKPFSWVHHKIHSKKRPRFWPGLPSMLIVCLIAIILLISINF